MFRNEKTTSVDRAPLNKHQQAKSRFNASIRALRLCRWILRACLLASSDRRVLETFNGGEGIWLQTVSRMSDLRDKIKAGGRPTYAASATDDPRSEDAGAVMHRRFAKPTTPLDLLLNRQDSSHAYTCDSPGLSPNRPGGSRIRKTIAQPGA